MQAVLFPFDVTATHTFTALQTFSAGITVSAGAVTLPAASLSDAALSSNIPLKNSANTFTGLNTFTNASGIVTRQAATQDGINLFGRAGGTSSFINSITTAALTASRTFTLPDANMTITGGGTLALGGFTLTVPATGTAALLATSNVFSAAQTIGTSGNTAILNLTSSSNVVAQIVFTTSSTLRGSINSDNLGTRLTVNAVDVVIAKADGTLVELPVSTAIGTTALLSTERLRVAGGSAPAIPGSTDVLMGAGEVRSGATSNTSITSQGGITHNSATLLFCASSLTNGAAGNTATLTNAPATGNPTKWVPIVDNGVTRYIPAW